MKDKIMSSQEGLKTNLVLTKISRKLFDNIKLDTERAYIVFQLVCREQNKQINKENLTREHKNFKPLENISVEVTKKSLNEIAKKRLFRSWKEIEDACKEISINGNEAIRLLTNEKGIKVLHASKEFRKMQVDYENGYIGIEKDNAKGINRTQRLIETYLANARYKIVKAEELEYFTCVKDKRKQVMKMIESCIKLGYKTTKLYQYTTKGRVLIGIRIDNNKLVEERQRKAQIKAEKAKSKKNIYQPYKNNNTYKYANINNDTYNVIESMAEKLVRQSRL